MFLIKIAQISKLQHGKILCNPAPWKTLQFSSCLCQKVRNQSTDNEKSRIYYGTLTPNITAVKLFSLTTSIAGLAAQPILYEQADKLSGGGTAVIAAVCGFVGFFTFVTPLLLHTITKRYVTSMDYDPLSEEYSATIIGFFMQKHQIKFKVEDVIVPEVQGMFSTFLVKPKGSSKLSSLFVDPKLFDDPKHYVKLMGFDKPIDFKLEFTEEQKARK